MQKIQVFQEEHLKASSTDRGQCVRLMTALKSVATEQDGQVAWQSALFNESFVFYHITIPLGSNAA